MYIYRNIYNIHSYTYTYIYMKKGSRQFKISFYLKPTLMSHFCFKQWLVNSQKHLDTEEKTMDNSYIPLIFIYISLYRNKESRIKNSLSFQ